MKWRRQFLRDLGGKAQAVLTEVNRRLGGIPLLLKRTLDSYSAHDGAFVSAAMAYYFFFTLFPLVLALIAIGSLFLDSQRARQAAVRFISQTVPVFESVVARNVDLVLAQRGPISILAALGFVYSASGLFGVLLTVVNRAWASQRARSSLAHRLLALGLVLGFALFFFVVLFATAAFETLGVSAGQQIGLRAAELRSLLTILSLMASFIVTAVLFLILYWKLPATRVHFADAWPAAVAAGLAWTAARSLFAWYFSQFARFTLVYGSLATIIGFLSWLYLTGYIILLGAELSAQIAERRGRGPAKRQVTPPGAPPSQLHQ